MILSIWFVSRVTSDFGTTERGRGSVMPADVLDELIAVFDELLPQLRRENGPVWAVVADRKSVTTFKTFPDAARFAHDQFGSRPVLIRHTEGGKVETAPFIHVRAGA